MLTSLCLSIPVLPGIGPIGYPHQLPEGSKKLVLGGLRKCAKLLMTQNSFSAIMLVLFLFPRYFSSIVKYVYLKILIIFI